MKKYNRNAISGFLILVVVVYLLKAAVMLRQETVISILVLGPDNALDRGRLEHDLREQLQLKSVYKKIQIEFLDPAVTANRSILMNNKKPGDVDILLADRADFSAASAAGRCANLTEVLTKGLYRDVEQELIKSTIVEFNESGTEITAREDKPFGISLAGSKVFRTLNQGLADPVVSVVKGYRHAEAVFECLRYMADKNTTGMDREERQQRGK